jgi:methylthioribose-1-phosphate isomerase
MRSERAWERFPPLVFDPDAGVLRLLDQTLLPFETRYVELRGARECAAAIRSMQVRGAPLIGLAAACGLALDIAKDPSEAALQRAAQELLQSRPTAVNLRWAVDAVRTALRCATEAERASAARRCAQALVQNEFACCAAIGEHGLGLLRRLADTPRARARGRLNVLTHCNAGWLTTGAWGTALAPLYRAAEEGVAIHVWVDETRPRNQGMRLTSWELSQSGIACSIVADNCAGHLMQRGLVDLCLVGSDRTTRRGDVCNKIGTYQKALAARDNDVPFYVALPLSTIDWNLSDGLREIVIEERDPREVLEIEGVGDKGRLQSVALAAPSSHAVNYAFDVTPARLVSGLICEHGIFAAEASELERLRGLARVAQDPAEQV